MDIKYTLIKKKRKNASISISLSGIVKISVPHFYTDKDIDKLISSKKDWILEKLNNIQQKNNKRISIPVNSILYLGEIYTFQKNISMGHFSKIDKENKIIFSGINLLDNDKLLKFYKDEANFLLPTRLRKIANEKGFFYNNISIKNNKSRWGSCTSSKNISLSTKLIVTPLFVIDAIILHELTHTEIMNHSQKFYNRLKEVCPFYNEADNWLKEYYPIENNIFY